MTQTCQELIQITQREAFDVPSINAVCAIRPLLWHGHAEAVAVAWSILLGKVLGSYCSEGSTDGMVLSPVC